MKAQVKQRVITQVVVAKNITYHPMPAAKKSKEFTWSREVKTLIATFYHSYYDPKVKKSWEAQFKDKGVYDTFKSLIVSLTSEAQFVKIGWQFKKIYAMDITLRLRGIGEPGNRDKSLGEYQEILLGIDS
ncbi:MAG: hypothetical protein R3321_04935 [Nitrososphaeraceae archaeon]|nr:hypothetical protein [Nitrososphaeraceae archaeon]